MNKDLINKVIKKKWLIVDEKGTPTLLTETRDSARSWKLSNETIFKITVKELK